MKTYKVPQTLASQYHGAGHALAAIKNGQIQALIYLHDVLPDYDNKLRFEDLCNAINLPELAATVKDFQNIGEAAVGMLSCWEFCTP